MIPTIRGLLAAALMAAFFVSVFWNVALPKDNGQWESVPAPQREWFRGLKRADGASCCGDADGFQLDEGQWRINAYGRFDVKLGEQWFEVPPDKVLQTQNQIGIAIVWIVSGKIFCFLPASLS